MIFKITRPGRYTIPNWGSLDTKKEVSNERLLLLYADKGFPWIELISGKKTVAFLKKQKLTEKQLAGLILNANTVSDVNVLLEVSSKKTLKTIAENRIKALQ